MEDQSDRGTPRANNTEPPKGGAAPDGTTPPFGNRDFLIGCSIMLSIPLGFVLLLFLMALHTARDFVPPETPLPGMSADLADFTVGYGGDVYALPAPLEEFLQNGWEVRRMSREEIEQNIPLWMREDEEIHYYRASELARPAGPDEVLSAGEERGTRLVRGDDEAVLTAWNPDPQPQPLRGCLVIQLRACRSDPVLMLSNGVTQHTNWGYIEDALAGTDFTCRKTGDYPWYRVSYGEDAYYEIQGVSLMGTDNDSVKVRCKLPPEPDPGA